MTVGELIDALREHEPEREVFVTVEVDAELYDAPVTHIHMRAGAIFVSSAED